MKRYSVDTAGAATAKVKVPTTLDAVVGGFTSMTKSFSDAAEADLVTVKEQGQGAIAVAAVAFLAGDWNGHRVAAQGGKSYVSRVTGG